MARNGRAAYYESCESLVIYVKRSNSNFQGELLPSEVTAFGSNGFLRKPLLTLAEVDSISAQLDDLERCGSAEDHGLTLRAGLLFEIFDVPLRGGALAELIGHERLVRMAEVLLQDSVEIAAGLMLDKPREASWDIDWHQDTSVYCRAIPKGQVGEIRGGLATFRPRDATMGRLLTARIAIDLDTDETGGLRVLPGTHLLGNCGPEGGKRFASERGIPCEQQPGDVLFFNPLLVHRAAHNRVSARRRVVHLTYRRRDERLPVGGEWMQWPSVKNKS